MPARREKRDSGRSSFPPVRVVTGMAFEAIAELAAFTSGPARASLDSGKVWIREVRRLAGAELIGRVERWTLGVYGELATVALEASAPRDIDELIRAIESFSADLLRVRLLGADSPLNHTMVSEGAFERAIAGDLDARAEVRSALATDRVGRRAIDRLLDSDPEAVKAELLDVLAAWGERVHPHFASDASAAIARDAKAKRTLLARDSGEAVVATATSGVIFDPSPWVNKIVLVPTVALRPFIVPTELRNTALFVYSVADESLAVDPGAPPRRLVKLASALGDELRLKILHVLQDNELNASEIAVRVGAERTSLHHHLGILRSAGLLTIRDEGERGLRYTLKENGLDGLGLALHSYLGRAPREQ